MAENEGMYVSNRNVTLRSETGHTVVFKKDEPVYLPPVMRRKAYEIGVLPVDGDMPSDMPEDKPKTVQPDPVGSEREEAITGAMKMIRDANKREHFTGAGTPKVEPLQDIVGFNIHSKERDRLWRELIQESSED